MSSFQSRQVSDIFLDREMQPLQNLCVLSLTKSQAQELTTEFLIQNDAENSTVLHMN